MCGLVPPREGWVASYSDNDILRDLTTMSYIVCREYCGPQKVANLHTKNIGITLWVHNIYQPTILNYKSSTL